MRVVHRGALFEEDAEFGVELVVGIDAILGFLLEEFEQAFRDNRVQFRDEGFVLHGLARDIEREILAIDDALEETQPLGEQVLGFRVDENFAAVESDGGFEAGEAELFGVILGDEEEGVD